LRRKAQKSGIQIALGSSRQPAGGMTMRKQLSVGSFVLACLFALQPFSANASTITFTENGDGPVMVFIDLTGCAGCIQFAALGFVEMGIAGYTVPGGFPGFPAGLTTGQAFVVEGAADDNLAGAISDSVILEIQNTPNVSASVLANFFSDSDGVTVFPPPVRTVTDTGGILNLTNFFYTQTPTGFTPLDLGQANLNVQVSDVPEPGTAVLLSSGLVTLLSAITWRRKRAE
jgi:hypothetical protein